MNWFLLSAGILNMLVIIWHFLSGRQSVHATLKKAQQLDNSLGDFIFLKWHLLTLALATMAGSLVYSALPGKDTILAVPAIFLALTMALWGLLFSLSKGSLFKYPQWILYMLIGILASTGIRMISG